MRIAAAQIACTLGDRPANFRKIEHFSSRAKEAGADLVVFPEMADTGYAMPTIRAHAVAWTDGSVPELRDIAKSLSIAIICGVSEKEGDIIYNSQIVLDRDGRVLASYRKTHLFTAPPNPEHLCFSPGNSLADFALGDLRFGLTICYDLRFPEMYRKLAVERNANVFINSAAWPFPRVEHFRALTVARAIENQSYFIAANRVGTDDGVLCCGTSAIVDPYGVILASASQDREELIHAELSADLLASVRGRMNVFSDRRRDLYQ